MGVEGPSPDNWGEVGELHMPERKSNSWGETDAFADEDKAAEAKVEEISDEEFEQIAKGLSPELKDMHPTEAGIRFASQVEDKPAEPQGEVVDFPKADTSETPEKKLDVA